jgi:1,4-alpha-glucan branching enzyme
MNILAFHRWEFGGPHDDVVCGRNLGGVPRGDYRIGMPAAGLWRLKFNSDARHYSEIFSDHPATDVVHGTSHRTASGPRRPRDRPVLVLVYSRA